MNAAFGITATEWNTFRINPQFLRSNDACYICSNLKSVRVMHFYSFLRINLSQDPNIMPYTSFGKQFLILRDTNTLKMKFLIYKHFTMLK